MRKAKYRIIKGYVGAYEFFYEFALQKKSFFGIWRTLLASDALDKVRAELRDRTGSEDVHSYYDEYGFEIEQI